MEGLITCRTLDCVRHGLSPLDVGGGGDCLKSLSYQLYSNA